MYLRTACPRLATPGAIRPPTRERFLNTASAACHPGRGFLLSAPSPTRSRALSTSTKRLAGGPTRSALAVLLCIGGVLAAAFHYGVLQVHLKIDHHHLDSDPLRSLTEVALAMDNDSETLEELNRYTRQVKYYQDKDPEYARQAAGKMVEIMEQHVDLVDPDSILGLMIRSTYVTILSDNPTHPDFLPETNKLLDSCKRKLEDYDKRGILNLPLRRDVSAFVGEQAPGPQQALAHENLTESEERKCVFQMLFEAYNNLVLVYLDEEGPLGNETMANRTIEDIIVALEAEFGPSLERAPLWRRPGSSEIDRNLILNYISLWNRRFEPSISPYYSPVLALKCLRHMAELVDVLGPELGASPCDHVDLLQRIATLVLDLACQSAPEGLLVTEEDRHYLAEAKRVQQRVLDLAAAVDPTRRDKKCDLICVEGLISMAKISWRCGDEKTGDQDLEKASRLADSINTHWYKEVIRRIDKDPSKTAPKDWEMTAIDQEQLGGIAEQS